MERFDPTIGNSDYEGEAWAAMQADPFGEYVEHGEAQAEIARLQAEAKMYREAAESWQKNASSWMASRNTAWNDAIEAAARDVNSLAADDTTIRWAVVTIRALRKET